MKKNEKSLEHEPSNTPTLMRLYRLIQAMTAVQKRDFRKYSQLKGDIRVGDQEKNAKSKASPFYIQLFDAINRFIKEEKAVETLQKNLERKHLGNRVVLSERADYLYTSILESLRATPDHGEMLNRLIGLMQDINTLYHKGLLSDCQILVAEASKIAREIDKPTYLLELLWWQTALQPAETERFKVNAAMDSIKMEQLQIIRHLIHTTEIRNIMHVLSAESRHVDASLDVVPEQWRPFFEMDLKESFQLMPGGARARMFFLTSFRSYGEISSKIHPEQRQNLLEKITDAQETLIAAFKKEFAVFAKEDPAHFYWKTLDNYITFCRRLEKHDRADELMQILEKEADKSFLIYNHLNKYIGNLDADGAIRYIEREHLLSEFEQFKELFSESRQITICYHCGLAYFMVQKWDKAQKWFAINMDGHRPDNHHLAVTITGLLDIICAFELKAYGGSVIRLFENFESRQKRPGQWDSFLKSLTDLLKNYLGKHNDQDISERLEPLREQITQHKLLGIYGVVLAWIEARLNGTDYLTELKKY